MALSRYAVVDVYTLEELRRQYRSSDVPGRIRFLAQFRKADDGPRVGAQALPFDIVFLAAQDDSVEVRQWIARNGCFDLQNWRSVLDGVPDPIDAIVNHLKSDPDPFVRACLYENQELFGRGNAEAAFGDATHLERLALVRNPALVRATQLIQKLFDPNNTELGIDLEQRRELALAFISNPEAQRDSRCYSGLLGSGQWIGPGDDWAIYESSNHWDAIWRLAAKWPPESLIPHYVFENISTDDVVKKEVYQHCEDAALRCTILEGCSSTEILKLGIKDSDSTCQSIALSKIPRWLYDSDPSGFEAILSSGDKEALSGLARNDSLSVEVLEKVAARLEALGDHFGPSDAKRTIERVREKQTSRGEKPKATPISRLPLVILLVTGVVVVLGAPLAMALGFGLIGVALAFLFDRRRYPEPAHPRS
jgi:hypothetical protein